MNAGVLRKLTLFFHRDLAIARSYRSPFVLEALDALFGAALFYWVARFVDSPQLARALPQGGSYFSFALVGFAFFDYLSVALDAFDRSIEDARAKGTLEPLLVTQTSLPVILAGSAIYPFVVTTLRIAIYLIWGATLFAFPLRAANWAGVLAMLVASVVAFSGLGILSASYLLLFKRGNPGKWFLLGVSSVVGGMLFPVSVLPPWLQTIAWLNPVTYALEGTRAALLGGAAFSELWKPIAGLGLFALVLLPSSMAVFSWALRRTKITGTLTHS